MAHLLVLLHEDSLPGQVQEFEVLLQGEHVRLVLLQNALLVITVLPEASEALHRPIPGRYDLVCVGGVRHLVQLVQLHHCIRCLVDLSRVPKVVLLPPGVLDGVDEPEKVTADDLGLGDKPQLLGLLLKLPKLAPAKVDHLVLPLPLLLLPREPLELLNLRGVHFRLNLDLLFLGDLARCNFLFHVLLLQLNLLVSLHMKLCHAL